MDSHDAKITVTTSSSKGRQGEAEIDLERVYRIADSMDKAIGIPNLDDGTLLRELAAAVETLRDDLADLEALRSEDHAAIRQTILEKEAAEARVVELAGALERVRQCCLFEEDLGRTGVTMEPHINEQLFDDICAALLATPAQAMEKARAVQKVAGYARHAQYCDLVYNPPEERSLQCSCGLTAALAKLDALGKERR